MVAVAGRSALAQVYPVKPIRLIVPFPSGGMIDLLARTLGPRLSVSNTPEQFAAYIKSEIAKWAKVIKDTGVKLDDFAPARDFHGDKPQKIPVPMSIIYNKPRAQKSRN
jgi:tripartite-type tricarboxylate transporter receptor subunit TctC